MKLNLRRVVGVWLVVGWCFAARSVEATDYFLTIAGGYSPAGNQASLEANVLFYQRILREKHPGPRSHDIFFSDGNDPAKDLQVEAEAKSDRPAKPATELIATLHRRGGPAARWIRNRNHEVPDIAGALDPELVRKAIERIAKTAKGSDRLIVYVTAHGDAAQEDDDDPFNTSISCWNEKEIRMSELTKWLDQLPEQMPVVMVMAQCYCGGFSHTLFEGADPEQGVAKRPRAGFFAQQHDLPAAGCRPDIENDEEYSSYFWGALIGQSRTGKPMLGCDADGNGRVSFEEAHAQALIAGRTIDISLKTSDVLLRNASRIPDYTLSAEMARRFNAGRTEEESEDAEKSAADEGLVGMKGPVEELLAGTSPATRRVVVELSRELELPLTGDVSQVLDALQKLRNSRVFGRGGGPPGRRSNSGRRDLLAEVAEKWPDLGDPEKWEKSDLLKSDDQAALMKEIEALPSYAKYQERREAREKQATQADELELRGVKYRRLVDTLESIVLAKNLRQVAGAEAVAGYDRLIQVEQSELSPSMK